MDMVMPAGSLPPPRDDLADVGMVHAMDGDGASLCEAVSSSLLVRVDHFKFSDAAGDQRCSLCESILAL
jgi:hypothetical protein